jgi:hypothetical protein
MNTNEIERNNNEGLRTASSLRFVFTRRQTEVKTVEIGKPKNLQSHQKDVPGRDVSDGNVNGPKARKPPGRKQVADPAPKKKTDKVSEETKKTKLEWGKAYKGMSEGVPPQFPIFMEFTETPECQADPFYLKIFREMAYGSFPKGIFYDNNRETVVCTEPPSKKNAATRKQRMDKYIRVCLPLRPEVMDADSKTNAANTNLQTTHNSQDERGLDREMECAEVETDNDRYRKAVRFIFRSYQRLELPIATLRNKYELSFERIYQELKLFIYMMIEMTSPKDSVLLQQDSYQMILTSELTSSLRPQKSWKSRNAVEQISLLCQYCKSCMVRIEGKPINQLSPPQQRVLRDIEDYVAGLYQTGCIRPSVITFDGNRVTDIRGLTIHSRGVDIDRAVLFEGFTQPEEPNTISPVVFQRYKTVSLQKIANGIDKQLVKISKLINDLAGEEEYL